MQEPAGAIGIENMIATLMRLPVAKPKIGIRHQKMLFLRKESAAELPTIRVTLQPFLGNALIKWAAFFSAQPSGRERKNKAIFNTAIQKCSPISVQIYSLPPESSDRYYSRTVPCNLLDH